MPTDDPLADDPAFAAWPAELRQAWAELSLPSLHDLLLGQERLAAEIRRQNQELRKLAGAPPNAAPPADAERLAAILAQASDLGQALAKASASGLIGVVEAADRHAVGLAAETEALLAAPNVRGWFRRARPWPEALAQRLRAQADGARLLADKARTALADAGVHAIRAAAGDAFDPEQHRCVETADGTAGRILRLVREGWRQGGAVLRPAEVAIGRNP